MEGVKLITEKPFILQVCKILSFIGLIHGLHMYKLKKYKYQNNLNLAILFVIAISLLFSGKEMIHTNQDIAKQKSLVITIFLQLTVNDKYTLFITIQLFRKE